MRSPAVPARPPVTPPGVIPGASVPGDKGPAVVEGGELEPNNATAYIGMGEAYLKQGVGPMAEAQFEKALEIDSTQTALLYRLANIYIKERQYNDGARTYQRLLALQPNNDAARLELANLYKRAKQWAKCASTLKDYFVRVPNPPKDVTLMYLEALYQSRRAVPDIDPDSGDPVDAPGEHAPS